MERDVKHIMDVAERISTRIGQRVDEIDEGTSARGFEIFANVVWEELASALMDELGSTLFAAGQPDEFRRVRTFAQTPCSESNAPNLRMQNHETTQAFIRSFHIWRLLRVLFG